MNINPEKYQSSTLTRQWLIESLFEMIDRDQHLWHVFSSERSRVARVHHYLANIVENSESGPMAGQSGESNWQVDCEYNRNSRGLKWLSEGEDKKYGTPDIIIHKRGESQNLLIVEFKQSWPGVQIGADDDLKMEKWMNMLGYKFGALVAFGPSSQPDPMGGYTQRVAPRIVWYENGVRSEIVDFIQDRVGEWELCYQPLPNVPQQA